MKRMIRLFVAFGIVLVLAACGSSDDKEESTTDGDSKEAEVPDTLVVGFVPSQESDTIADTVEPLTDRLSEELGIEVKGQVMTSYNALVEAMATNHIQIGFITAFGYVLANEQYEVEVILKSIRHGAGSYKAQYVVRTDSGIETLADLEGKIWAYADQGSTAGYLFPASDLMEEFDYANAPELESDFFSNTVAVGDRKSVV